eukprot:m.85104 g.85104  ORF g.85104 m.85104 type:complete len:133 (-) comp12995_c0_seq4:793-1191(-)
MVRLKHRHLLVEIIFEDGLVDENLKFRDVLKAVQGAVQAFHGDYGLGCIMSSFQVKYFNPMTSICLLRVSKDHYEELWSALTLMTSLNSRSCLFTVIHVGGTIRSCQKALIKKNKQALALDKANAADHIPVE